MEILGFIPARGGSQGVPHKNLTLLGNRPLLFYTCDAARASQKLTRIVLSTDDPAIAEVGRKNGAEVLFLRPVELAQDDTPMLKVIQHALNFLNGKNGYQPEVVVLLQPTSPLRRTEHIDAAVDLLLKTGADSVVSVIEVPHQFSPVSLMVLEEDRLLPFQKGPLVSRRQDKPRLYARNGPAVLAVRREVLTKKNTLYGEECRPLVMSAEDSIDIDGPLDLQLAEFLLKQRQPIL